MQRQRSKTAITQINGSELVIQQMSAKVVPGAVFFLVTPPIYQMTVNGRVLSARFDRDRLPHNQTACSTLQVITT